MAKLVVNVEKEMEKLGDLFGIFFEDLNHAADGGLYAQLVRNGSFEFDRIDHPSYDSRTAWEMEPQVGCVSRHSIQMAHPLSEKNPHYLVVDIMRPGDGFIIKNLGYGSGIPIIKGDTYRFSCYVASDGRAPVTLDVYVEDSEGNNLECGKIIVDKKAWCKKEFIFEAEKTEYKGKLVIKMSSPGRLYLDFVSLFPTKTFKNRENGLRKDIAQLLYELKPKFMRFPGGCLVHDGSLNAEDRDSLYRWKNTLGKLEERPSRKNNWGYNQSLGLGYYEYFLFCEDIHAKPIPVLPAAYNPHHQSMVPFDQMDEWIQEALDLIEFANGDESTPYGRLRCGLGHEQPFGLEYLAIGNEEVGEGFFERYPYFHKAIKGKYPEIKLIASSGPFAAGGEYEKGWTCAIDNKADLVDEHYYQAPEWFLANHHRYDNFKVDAPHVFLGEYASWGNCWYNALVEASYMIGLERNAPVVELACYAPLLCNVDYINWEPDMIWYNNHEVFGTANYYVQKLFMNHQGDCKLEVTASDFPPIEKKQDSLDGIFAFLPVPNTVCKYWDIKITDLDTGVIKEVPGEFILEEGRDWQVFGESNRANYSLCCKGIKVSGTRGFQICFGGKDKQNKLFWELGGWQNMDSIVGEDIDGKNACLTQSFYTVDLKHIYDLELVVKDNEISTFIDGKLINHIRREPLRVEPLYFTASKEDESGDIIIKTVNVKGEKLPLSICLEWFEREATKAIVYEMSGYELDAKNSFEDPKRVVPIEKAIVCTNNCLNYEIEPYSVTIFRIQ